MKVTSYAYPNKHRSWEQYIDEFDKNKHDAKYKQMFNTAAARYNFQALINNQFRLASKNSLL